MATFNIDESILTNLSGKVAVVTGNYPSSCQSNFKAAPVVLDEAPLST
jgi:hypothetical protein